MSPTTIVAASLDGTNAMSSSINKDIESGKEPDYLGAIVEGLMTGGRNLITYGLTRRNIRVQSNKFKNYQWSNKKWIVWCF